IPIRSVLSDYLESSYILAAWLEMRSWNLLELDAKSLRLPSDINGYPMVTLLRSSLPEVLFRLKTEQPLPIRSVSRDMVTLCTGVREVQVEKDTIRGEYYVTTKMEDGLTLPARLLSDGTLRLLAMMTMKNDPLHQGLLMIEEPENGVHPGQLERLVQRLREM